LKPLAPRVLVIDDSASVRAEIEGILAPRGFEIASCASGYEAVARLPDEAPDLVLCDLVLPDVDGYQICRWVRQVPRLAATRMILVSGIVDDEVEREAARLGVLEVLRKPLDAAALIAATERIFGALPAGAAVGTGGPAPIDGGVPLAPAARQALGEILALPGFRCLIQLAPQPRVLALAGEQTAAAAPLVTEPLVHLLAAAAAATAGLGLGDLALGVLEAGAGTIVIRRDDGGAALVLLLANPASVGKARLLLGRLPRPLGAGSSPWEGAESGAAAGQTAAPRGAPTGIPPQA
jgi:twitching motility two-component system response regulator PilG